MKIDFKRYWAMSFIAGSVAIGVSQNTMAEDWPQWRGANRDDISKETGLLKEWPAEGLKPVWKAAGIGLGYSCVSVVGDRIFAMGDKGDNNFVFALNKADGKVLWSAKIGKPGAPGWGGFTGTRGAPTVDEGLVYAIGQYGEIVCVNATDGKEVWRKDMADFGGKLPEWGYAESVLVDGNLALLTPGGAKGTIVALNKKTGETVWQTQDVTDGAHYSSMIIAEIGGVRQYIQLTAANVLSVNKDGKLLWKAPRKGATAVIPTPIYADNHVYVSSGYGIGCNLFKISVKDGAFSAEQVYANKVMANHHGGVVKVGDFLYGYSDGKGWVCQNFKTGDSVWASTKVGKGSVTFADGMLYCREEGSATVALVQASPDAFKEAGRLSQPECTKKNVWPHPVISGGKLYLRDQDNLFCFDVKSK